MPFGCRFVAPSFSVDWGFGYAFVADFGAEKGARLHLRCSLGHGLLTVPLAPTEGLPLHEEETCGQARGQGQETLPQQGGAQEEPEGLQSGQRAHRTPPGMDNVPERLLLLSVYSR